MHFDTEFYRLNVKENNDEYFSKGMEFPKNLASMQMQHQPTDADTAANGDDPLLSLLQRGVIPPNCGKKKNQ